MTPDDTKEAAGMSPEPDLNPNLTSLYHRGVWSDAPDPLGSITELTSDDTMRRQLGFELIHTLGSEFDGFALKTYQRVLAPRYLIGLEFPDRWDYVLASDTVDMMDLLKAWLPVARDAAFLSFLSELTTGEGEDFTPYDRIARAGARAAWGAQRADWFSDEAHGRKKILRDRLTAAATAVGEESHT